MKALLPLAAIITAEASLQLFAHEAEVNHAFALEYAADWRRALTLLGESIDRLIAEQDALSLKPLRSSLSEALNGGRVEAGPFSSEPLSASSQDEFMESLEKTRKFETRFDAFFLKFQQKMQRLKDADSEYHGPQEMGSFMSADFPLEGIQELSDAQHGTNLVSLWKQYDHALSQIEALDSEATFASNLFLQANAALATESTAFHAFFDWSTLSEIGRPSEGQSAAQRNHQEALLYLYEAQQNRLQARRDFLAVCGKLFREYRDRSISAQLFAGGASY